MVKMTIIMKLAAKFLIEQLQLSKLSETILSNRFEIKTLSLKTIEKSITLLQTTQHREIIFRKKIKTEK